MQMGESGFGGLSGRAKLNFMAGQYARWKTRAFYVKTLLSPLYLYIGPSETLHKEWKIFVHV